MDNTAPYNNQYNPYSQPQPQPVFQAASTNPAPAPVPTVGTIPKLEEKYPIVWIVALVIASIVAMVFIGLFIWMYVQWDDAHTDVEGQITRAVAEAVNETTTKLESEFSEREKTPYKTFAAPSDLGGLSFQYPKTWSVYVARDGRNGGQYEAYLNPDKVSATDNNSINSLRVSIRTATLDSVNTEYNSYIQNGQMTMEMRIIGGGNANIYTGKLLGGELVGRVAVFKIRDKVVTLQTDAMVFTEDFNRILSTVQYNQ